MVVLGEIRIINKSMKINEKVKINNEKVKINSESLKPNEIKSAVLNHKLQSIIYKSFE